MSKQRQSNFELLRILAMLMIILFHISLHGNIVKYFAKIPFSINKCWLYGLRSLGKVGVNIFVLISGYFLINKNKISIPKILKLWLHIVFYCVGIYLLFVGLGREPFEIKRFLITFLPITFNEWWFASTYFILYLLSPFINRFLHSLDKKDYKKLLIITTIMWSIIPTFLNTDLECGNLLWFIYLYALAGYINLYKDDFKTKPIKCFVVAFLFMIIGIAVSMTISWLMQKNMYWKELVFHIYNMETIVSLVMAVSIFVAFKNINIKENKIINTISASTFGIYLMHDHDFIRLFIWREFFKLKKFRKRLMFIPYSLGMAIVVFIFFSIIEIIRIRFLEKYYMKLIYKINPKLESIKNKIWESKIVKKVF